jgi:choline transport protein
VKPGLISIRSNGGPPAVIYEFILVSIFYWIIAASLAELASSMPSSAGVYHWASITPGPKYGRVCGWFAGWWNFLAWNFACGKFILQVENLESYPDGY